MTVSTLVTLILVPVLYTTFAARQLARAERKARRRTEGRAAGEALAAS